MEVCGPANPVSIQGTPVQFVVARCSRGLDMRVVSEKGATRDRDNVVFDTVSSHHKSKLLAIIRNELLFVIRHCEP